MCLNTSKNVSQHSKNGSRHPQNGSQHPQNGLTPPKMGVSRCEMGAETHFGVSTPPKTGVETQTKGSQHLYRVENDTLNKGTFYRVNKAKHKTQHDLRVQNPSLNKMLAQFPGRSSPLCVLWCCPQFEIDRHPHAHPHTHHPPPLPHQPQTTSQTTHTNHTDKPTPTHKPTTHQSNNPTTQQPPATCWVMPCFVISCHTLSLSGLGNVRACCLPWKWQPFTRRVRQIRRHKRSATYHESSRTRPREERKCGACVCVLCCTVVYVVCVVV